MSESQPLVSIIILCYNHEKFVEEAVESVLTQTHSNIEIIIVDDASTDNSQQVIQRIVDKHRSIKLLLLEKNMGSCAAFNIGYGMSKGDYIIDLAADDLLLPNRIEKGVQALESAGIEYGVNFSNANLIDENAKFLKYFYPIDINGYALDKPMDGDIYELLIKKYFICPPTLFSRRTVFDYLGGYDETLAYEDFDFLIRSSRKYKFCYSDEVLVQKRILKTSMSAKQYSFKSLQMYSTLEICKKIDSLNRTSEERGALRTRIYYEMRQCLKTGNFILLLLYLKLLLR